MIYLNKRPLIKPLLIKQKDLSIHLITKGLVNVQIKAIVEFHPTLKKE